MTLTPRVSRHIGYHPIKAIGDLSNSRRCPLSLGASRSRFRPSSAFGELKSSVNLGHLVGLGLGETGVVRCASDAATSAPRTSSRCGWWIDDAARVVMVIGNEKRTSGRVEMVPLYAARIEDLGPGSFVKRLPRLRTHGVADASIPGPTWAGAAPQSARPEGSGPMSGVWCSRPSRRVGQMGKDAA